MLVAALLVYCALIHIREGSASVTAIEFIGVGLALFVLLGLWTPIVGALLSLIEVWVILSRTVHPRIPIILATLAASLAMIGPGAWSIDARLFGRKHIETTGL